METYDHDLPLGTRILDRYVILGKLTQGGMAEVYLAQQLGPGNYQKLCVVKRVRPHLAKDADFVAMFTNEARLAAKINHPNVVQIFDLGQGGPAGGDWFLTMEYLDGRDMLQIGRACRAHNKAVPFDVTARIISDACAGLEFAHQLKGDKGEHLNLVHRDMSPENVLITFEGHVKVVDFGIAKAADNAFRTQAGQIKGKLGYVAPEAILGQKLDARADIFAIGATLYLFLCGRPAFTGTNPMEVFERSLQPPTPPSEVNSRVPKALEDVCMNCLTQDPKNRYQTAAELRAALEGYLTSTGRPLGRPQLAQFMRILFPPGRDPHRQRVDGLIREGQAMAGALSGEGEPEVTLNRAPQDVDVTNITPADISGLVPTADIEATAIVSAESRPPPVNFSSDDRTAVGHVDTLQEAAPFSVDSEDERTREVDTSILRELSNVLDDSFEPTPPPMPQDDSADDDDDDFGVDIDFDMDEGHETIQEATAAPPPVPSDEHATEMHTARVQPQLSDELSVDGPEEPTVQLSTLDPSMEPPPIAEEPSLTPIGPPPDLSDELDFRPIDSGYLASESLAPPPPPESTDAMSLAVPMMAPIPRGPSMMARLMSLVVGMLLGAGALGVALYLLGWLEPTLGFFGLG